jgi:signal transduction histidine kinase
MPKNPSNSDLQQQIRSLETEVRNGQSEIKSTIREMSGKLDRALEASAAHTARLDAHDTEMKNVRTEVENQANTAQSQFLWIIGCGFTSLLAALAALASWIKCGN